MSSALTRRGSTRRWLRIRDAILLRDRHTCQKVVDGRLCGAYAATVGHIVRREHGGGDSADNLQAQCGPCNYGERPPPPAAAARPSLGQLAIARVLDEVGLPTTTGRRVALKALQGRYPGRPFACRDVDAACAWRRGRGPLTRA